MTSPMTPTTHGFVVHQNILIQLIKKQSGTLGKALLELHMNSVDAGCESTSLELSQDGFVFEDNGKGFASEQEIHDLFGCVGWPHEEGARVYGEFGLGRLQILNYASTEWKTNGMQMSVDIETKGLNYEVLHGTNSVKGLRIEGKFFKPMALRDLVNTIDDFKRAVKYSPVPITLNGERIDTDRTKVKWTHETEDAYILVRPSMRDISVYNQGVYVRDYPAHHFGGSGGVVVTKHGVKLTLNTARNDIITQDCKAWARIKPFLMDQAKKERKQGVRFTEDVIRFQRHEFDAGESFEPFYSGKFIKDVQGKVHSFKSFQSKSWHDVKIGMADPKQRALVTAHDTKAIVLFDQNCLATLGCENILEFQALAMRVEERFGGRFTRNVFGKAIAVEDTSDFERRFRHSYKIIDPSEYTKAEKIMLSCLGTCSDYLSNCIRSSEGHRFSEHRKPRGLAIGVSENAMAWTNGIDYIALDRDYLREQFKNGLAGFVHLCMTLAHEYAHPDGSDDPDTHAHGLDFYERFHNLVTGEHFSHFMDNSVLVKYADMAQRCAKAGIPLAQKFTHADKRLSNVDAARQAHEPRAQGSGQPDTDEGGEQLRVA